MPKDSLHVYALTPVVLNRLTAPLPRSGLVQHLSALQAFGVLSAAQRLPQPWPSVVRPHGSGARGGWGSASKMPEVQGGRKGSFVAARRTGCPPSGRDPPAPRIGPSPPAVAFVAFSQKLGNDSEPSGTPCAGACPPDNPCRWTPQLTQGRGLPAATAPGGSCSSPQRFGARGC